MGCPYQYGMYIKFGHKDIDEVTGQGARLSECLSWWLQHANLVSG